MKIDRDRINNADPAQVAMTAAALFDVIQDKPAEVRTMGAAAFLKLFFEWAGIEPQDAMTAVGNLMAEAERVQVRSFAGLREYLRADF